MLSTFEIYYEVFLNFFLFLFLFLFLLLIYFYLFFKIYLFNLNENLLQFAANECDAAVIAAIRAAVARKHAALGGHHNAEHIAKSNNNRPMILIGG